jgi:hypothetical protein
MNGSGLPSLQEVVEEIKWEITLRGYWSAMIPKLVFGRKIEARSQYAVHIGEEFG